MIQLAIEYIQCYWQAFGLGMVAVLLIQHMLKKRKGKANGFV